MLSHMPPKRRKRVFAIYIVVTILGGAVLIVFLVLLTLLYWAYAGAPLPEVARLIHPEATAYWVIEIESTAPYSRSTRPRTPTLLSGGADSPVAGLVRKGVEHADCPIQVAASLVPGVTGPEPLFAISFGKFPGMFFLKRRDLERRCVKQTISASVRYHNKKPIFLSENWKPFRALSLTRCSILRGTDAAKVAALIERVLAEKAPSAPWPDPEELRLESSAPSDFWGWAKHWQSVPLESVLPIGTAKRLADLEAALVKAFPSIKKAGDFRFWGQTLDGGFSLRLSFKPVSDQDGARPAAALADWLKKNGACIGIGSPEAMFDGKKGRINLKMRVTVEDP